MSQATLDVHSRILELSLRLKLPGTEQELGLCCRELQVATDELATLPTLGVGALSLESTELFVLYLLVALEGNRTLASLAQEVGEYSTDMPTLEGLRRLLRYTCPSALMPDVLSPRRLLRRLSLIERGDDGASKAHERTWTWTVSRRVMCELRGTGEIADEIADACSMRPSHENEPVVSPRMLVDLEDALRSNDNVVVVSGGPSVGKSAVLQFAAQRTSNYLLNIELAGSVRDLEHMLRLIARESAITGAVAVFESPTAEQLVCIGRVFVPLIEAPIIVTCGVERPVIKWDRPVVVIEMPPPTTAQRAELWKRGLDVSDGDADLLAERYPLAPGLIVRAAEAAKARANGRKLGQEDVFAGIRAVLDDKLGTYAKRVNVTQSWDDLVLPQEQLDPIVELMARVRGRRRVYEQWGFAAKVGKGLGVSALFSGPPGTGKTMVAALIAKELGLELYQVDMAKLVSKYIGETEKHLAAMFDAAEAGHAILLFDECDSLFGRRTEVRTSNDRYANLETNYLLQRLESFTGICLLTTNHESNLDPAFHRRLSLHVRFDLPDERERAKLWRAVLPAAAPVNEDVDFAGLARRYEMSGGYIKNAALRAAFLAADEDAPIGAAHLERAARVEYEAMGKLAA